jgi:hypothetical protein
MRLPPQVSAVRRESVSQILRSNGSPGALPATKATGQSIKCWASGHTVFTCGTNGAACCDQSANGAAWSSDGLCVCQ